MILRPNPDDALLRAEGDLHRLLELWRDAFQQGQAQSLRLSDFEHLSRELIAVGAPTDCIEVARAGLKRFPQSLRLAHLEALALARLGATGQAQELLTALLKHTDATGEMGTELLGAIGRTHRDLAANAQNHSEQIRQYKMALEAYRRGFERSESHYCGVNAATLLMLLGRKNDARALANQISAIVLELDSARPAGQAQSRLWLSATLGECALINSNPTAAQSWYRTAHLLASAQRKLADIAATRRQALLLAPLVDVDPQEVLRWLPRPKVLIFSGHRFDFLLDRRPAPRLPIHWEASLSADLESWLRSQHFMQTGELCAGYSSLSVGADLCFLEALSLRQSETHIVLPLDQAAYLESCCAAHGAAYRLRLEAALARATSVTVASPKASTWRDRDFHLCNELISGLAGLRAQALDAEVTGLLVWDGETSAQRGGTYDAARMWAATGMQISAIRPRAEATETAAIHAVKSSIAPIEEAAALAFLFADFCGFSALSDESLPIFIDTILGGVATHLADAAAQGRAALCKNTWGDGVFLTFARPSHAAHFALALNEWVEREQPRWRDGALANMAARISLHAGNATEARDPVTGNQGYWGAHVSMAARLEPATPNGVVYTSEPFAALLQHERAGGFKCEFVGRIAWAKNAGSHPTWRLTRSHGKTP